MPTRISESENINSVQLKNQGAAPSSPASGFVQLYTKGSSLWVKHSDGSVSPIAPLAPGGRLTLTTGVPVTTSDVTAASTLYYTPYLHDIICLFDGTADWVPMQFSELSLDLTGYTAAKPYDIFAYNNSGVVALESLVWTNGTTRATALAWQNGRLVKSGATTRLYLGTIYMSATSQTEDSATKRFVWNNYNRVPRSMLKEDTTTSWTYNLTAWRQVRAAAANQVEFVLGLSNFVWLKSQELIASGEVGFSAIGIDSTSAATSEPAMMSVNTNVPSLYMNYPAVGYHYAAMLESCYSATTTTFRGVYGGVSANTTHMQGYITG